MKLLLYLLLTFQWPQQAEVLVCRSAEAYAYHSYTCQGLKQCTHKIETISLQEAKRIGRKACGYCYNESPDSEPVKAAQCKAKTQKGTRCSRKAGANGYCWQHG